ncbi:MAG: glycerophosphodiester phosphodiesterase, partial [Verrucomicrobia bacterium]|nr:glycerophosphodiester phosphodiesterase [Verrucomicrobiota bacterium]
MNRTLSRLGAVPFSVVQSFDWGYLRRYRALSSEQLLGALGPPAVWRGSRLAVAQRLLNARFLDDIRDSGFQLAVWNHQVDRVSVREAHRRGLKVFVYTVNDPVEARRLLQAGVDGLISDNPCRIWRVMLACVRASGTASSGASRKGSATR